MSFLVVAEGIGDRTRGGARPRCRTGRVRHRGRLERLWGFGLAQPIARMGVDPIARSAEELNTDTLRMSRVSCCPAAELPRKRSFFDIGGVIRQLRTGSSQAPRG